MFSWNNMSIEQFKILPEERIVLIGCKRSDIEAFLRQNKHIRDRIIHIEEDDLRAKKTFPSNIKGVLSGRFISHADSNRIRDLMNKRGLHFFHFDDLARMKNFLSLSCPIVEDQKKEEVVEVREPEFSSNVDNNQSPQGTQEIPAPVVEIHKPKSGEVLQFIYDHIDLGAPVHVRERERLYKLALSIGIGTTPKSIQNSYNRVRKELRSGTDNPRPTDPKSHKPKKNESVEIFTRFFESCSEHHNNALLAGVAAKELIEELETTKAENIRLKAEVNRLSDENKKLTQGVRKKLKDFMETL